MSSRKSSSKEVENTPIGGLDRINSHGTDEIVASLIEKRGVSLLGESRPAAQIDETSPISRFGISPIRSQRGDHHQHDLSSSHHCAFPLLVDPNSSEDGHSSHPFSNSLFDHLVNEVQLYLIESFLSHPTLRQLLVVTPYSPHENRVTNTITTLTPRRADVGHRERKGEEEQETSALASSADATIPFSNSAVSLPTPEGSPSPYASIGKREMTQTFTLDASMSASPFSAMPVSRAAQEGMGSPSESPQLLHILSPTVSPSCPSVSRVGKPLVMVKDILLPSSQQAGVSPSHVAPSALSDSSSGGFLRVTGETGFTGVDPPTAMRVEIHYCNTQHEIARRHGLDLFLLVRPVVLKSQKKVPPPPQAVGSYTSGAYSSEEGKPGRLKCSTSYQDQLGFTGLTDADYSVWKSSAASSLNTFFLSVLWTACCNVFSSRGPVQLDLQHMFYRRDMKYNTLTPQGCFFTNVFHPPPSLAYGGPLHLPILFPLPSTALPCFVAGSMKKHDDADATTSLQYDEVDCFITDNAITSNALLDTSRMCSHERVFRGISTVYNAMSPYQRLLVASGTTRAFFPLSEDGGSLGFSSGLGFGVSSTLGGGSVGSSGSPNNTTRRMSSASVASTLLPSQCFMSQFYDLPTLSSLALPPVLPETTSPSSQEFESGGKEMIQYLLNYFKWQLGPKARPREWRRLRNGRSPNLALLHVLDRGSGESVLGSHGESKIPSCCISLRKLYRYSIPRQSSLMSWKSSWEVIDNYNRQLCSLCGDTTYPFGLTTYPVEALEFYLQFNQLDEEEVSHPETLNPFTDAAFRNGFIAETCTVKGRAVVGKLNHTQSKVAQKLSPVLARFLKVLRQSLDTNETSTKRLRQLMCMNHRNLSRKNSTSETGDSGLFSLLDGGMVQAEDDEENIEESMPRRLAKKAARRVLAVPKTEASMQAMLVSRLIKSEIAENSSGNQFSCGFEEGSHEEVGEGRETDMENAPFDLHLMLQEMGLPIPETVSASCGGDLGNGKGPLESAEQNSFSNPLAKNDKNDSVVHDLRRGYLPESFLCRFAFYAADQLGTCADKDDWLLILMEMWHICLEEMEKGLEMCAADPAKASRVLRRLLSVLGLPKPHSQSGEVHAVDLSQTILVQKLQFLSYCVYHLLEVPSGTSHKHTGATARTSADEENSCRETRSDSGLGVLDERLEGTASCNSLDESEEEEEEGLRDDKRPSRLPTLTLLTNGECFFPPPPLPSLPSTLDGLMEQNFLSNSAAELAVAPLSKLYSLRAYNEMCLFLYCSKGKVVRFPDFVQWVSPQDFRQPAQQPCFDDNEYLSERMRIPAEAAIWGPPEQQGRIPKEEEEKATRNSDALSLPVLLDEQKSANDACLLNNGGSTGYKMPSRGSSKPGQSINVRDTNNVWWVLWCRAFPRSRSQIIADSLCHFDQAMELIRWMKKSITPAALCLELAQASVANAMHRILVAIPFFAHPSSRGTSASAFSFRKFLQSKTNVLFNHLFPISHLFNMAATSFAAGGMFTFLPTISNPDIDDVQLGLQRAVGELLEMEHAVCCIKDLESVFGQFHRSSNGSVKNSHMNGDEDIYPAQLLVNPVIHPSNKKKEQDRLNLALETISLEDWFKHFAVLFTKKKPFIVEAQIRMACLAERPIGTTPCFQQLIADIKPSNSIRLSLTLSQEVM